MRFVDQKEMQEEFLLFKRLPERTASSGTVAQVLALPPHSKKVLGSIPAWGAVGPGE